MSTSQLPDSTPTVVPSAAASSAVNPAAVTIGALIWRGVRPIALSASRSRPRSRTPVPISRQQFGEPDQRQHPDQRRDHAPRRFQPVRRIGCLADLQGPAGRLGERVAHRHAGRRRGAARDGRSRAAVPGSRSRRVSMVVEITRPPASGSMLRPTMCRICGRPSTVIRTQSPTRTSRRSSSPCPATASSGPWAARPSTTVKGYGRGPCRARAG